jgi:BA14K-like protein
MRNRVSTLAVAALLAMSIAPFANVASATPVADALAIKNAASTNVETVQWRGRGYGRGYYGRGYYGRGYYGPGWGVGAGLLGGAIVGGMLAAPYYYGSGPYYAAPGYVAPAPEDAVAYCMQRFRSYDPNSGTYLGNDGYRHPCP